MVLLIKKKAEFSLLFLDFAINISVPPNKINGTAIFQSSCCFIKNIEINNGEKAINNPT